MRCCSRSARLIAAYACFFATASCDSPLASAPGDVDRIILSPSSASVQAGATLTLVAVVVDASGNEVRDRKVVWASENEGIASVSQSGVVTGIAAGVVQIAASSAGRSASATITVTARPVSLVRITPGSATISVSSILALQVEALDASGAAVVGRPVAWSSSNQSIAIVSASGVVAGLTAGSVTITATIDGRAGTAAITVAPQPVAAVVVTPDADTVTLGGRVTLRATAFNAENQPLADRIVFWSSNNPTVATVTSEGEVLALAIGSARIRATVEGKFADATILVQPVPVALVVVAPNQITLNPGQTSQLTVTLSDSAGNVLADRSVTFSASNPQIAAVSAEGLVIAVAEGTAQIQARSESKSATVAVTVNRAPIASIAIVPNAITLRITQPAQLSAMAFDAQGSVLSNRSFTWTSDAPSVATVDQSGIVTAVSAGSATITASSEGKAGTATVGVTSNPTASITISPKPLTLSPSQTQQLSVQLFDSAGGAVSTTGLSITWLSRDPTIATVSSSGLVGAVSPGSTYVLVSTPSANRSVLDSVSVTVATLPSVHVATVAVTPTTVSLLVNATAQLNAVAQDSAGSALPRTITWVSQAPNVATVSTSGLVTATASGSTTIEARATGAGVNGSDVIGTAAVTVTTATLAPVHSVSVTSARGFVVPADTAHVTVVLRDAQNNVLTGRAITFASNSPSTMNVDSAGVITGIATSGNSNIIATSEGKSGQVQVDALAGIATMTLRGPANDASDLIIARKATKKYTVTVTDGAGNPISGHVITISTASNIVTPSKTSLTTNSSGSGTVDIKAHNTPGVALINFTASRGGAIPPGTPGNNTPVVTLPIVVP